jgi:CubicO group peptidase (beta-lactamase class C family)
VASLADLLTAAVGPSRIPGAVVVAGRGPLTLEHQVAGHADTTPGSARAIRPDTVFDLASLTKVVATTTVTLALAARGALALDDPVAAYLPRFTAARPAAQPKATVRHLLTHTSGLPGSRKFYQWCRTREELLDDLYLTPLNAPPGTTVAYSDPGFIVLGELVAAVTGSTLDDAARRLVFAPLGMTSAGFIPSGPPARFAATERRADSADGSPWTGTVHDENARLLGGAAGHAGLFATAADLARFAAWWVSDTDAVVPAALRREAATSQTTGQTAGLGGCRGLGWTCRGDGFDILDPPWPSTAVSHTGFTGTSLALDPATGWWVVLLTNAVHAGRDATAIRALRRAVHATVPATTARTA